ncbi:MAG: hypothetical protein HY898_02270 [Deltaproteobacteria bacterium]|nr:hypothetical protein [Deltaproteobacteria bacterium]
MNKLQAGSDPDRKLADTNDAGEPRSPMARPKPRPPSGKPTLPEGKARAIAPADQTQSVDLSNVAQALSATGEALKACGDLAKPGLAAVSALREANTFKWYVSDRVYEAVSGDTRTRPDVSRSMAFAELQARGAVGMGTDPDPAIAAREAQAKMSLVDDYRRGLAAQFAEQATTLASAAADALEAFGQAVDNALVDSQAPRSLVNKGQSIEALISIEHLAVELSPKPVSEIKSLWQNAIERGDVERAEAIELAATRGLVELTSSGVEAARKLKGSRRFWRDGEFSKETGDALQLLGLFDTARKERIPDAVRIASGCYAGLLSVFRETCGLSAQHLERGAYESAFLKGDALDAPLRIDPNWCMRPIPTYAPLGPTMSDGYRRRNGSDDRKIAGLMRLNASERARGAVAQTALATKGR